jgi:hypothetical protein
MTKLTLLALTLALIFPPPSANASLTRDELQVLVKELEERSVWKEPSCVKSTDASKTLVFAFEGAGGYCPRYAFLNLLYGTDGKTFAEKILSTPESFGNLPYLRKIRALISSEEASRNCYFARSISEAMLKLTPEERSRIDLRYYSKDGNGEAEKCALLDHKNRKRLLGFSMGAYAALQFAQGLERTDHPIEKVLTIDPVGKNTQFITGVFFSLDNPTIKRTKNASSWKNYFQKFDTRSIYDTEFMKLWARGSRVIESDADIEIEPMSFEDPWGLEFPHFGILMTKEVQNEIVETLR